VNACACASLCAFQPRPSSAHRSSRAASSTATSDGSSGERPRGPLRLPGAARSNPCWSKQKERQNPARTALVKPCVPNLGTY